MSKTAHRGMRPRQPGELLQGPGRRRSRTSIYDMVARRTSRSRCSRWCCEQAEGNQSSRPRCSASTATRCARSCSSTVLDQRARVRPVDHGPDSSCSALISVSDKTGLVELRGAGARSASSSCRPAARRSCSPTRRRRSPRSPTTPASRNDGRPREDAAPEGARRPPRAARRAGAHGRARAARHRARSTCWS